MSWPTSFGIEALKNAAMDATISWHRSTHAAQQDLIYIYDNTLTGSVMRSFLVKAAVYDVANIPRIDVTRYAELIKKGGELGLDFTVILDKQYSQKWPDPTYGEKCDFHEYKDTPACKK